MNYAGGTKQVRVNDWLVKVPGLHGMVLEFDYMDMAIEACGRLRAMGYEPRMSRNPQGYWMPLHEWVKRPERK